MGASCYAIAQVVGRPGKRRMGNWNQVRDEAIGAHIDASGQYADAIEAGIGADGPACILHTGTRSGGLGQVKSRTGMPT